MPNPYHDETGRFCSSDEMGAAVERLANAGKLEEAYLLAKEHTAASRAEMDAMLAGMKEFGVPAPLVSEPERKANMAMRINGSSRTRLNYYCDAAISRVKLTCLTTV